MEMLQQLGIAVLLVFNVFMWTQVYNLRLEKIVKRIKAERQHYLDTLYNVATGNHKLLMAQKVARITHKKLVLA